MDEPPLPPLPPKLSYVVENIAFIFDGHIVSTRDRNETLSLSEKEDLIQKILGLLRTFDSLTLTNWSITTAAAASGYTFDIVKFFSPREN